MVPRVGFESVCPLLCDDEVANASFSLACLTHINAIIVAIVRNAFFMSVVRFGLGFKGTRHLCMADIFALSKNMQNQSDGSKPALGQIREEFRSALFGHDSNEVTSLVWNVLPP